MSNVNTLALQEGPSVIVKVEAGLKLHAGRKAQSHWALRSVEWPLSDTYVHLMVLFFSLALSKHCSVLQKCPGVWFVD